MSSDGMSNKDFEIETALKAFRLWSGHPHIKRRDITAGQTAIRSAGSQQSESQSTVWMSYYRLLSRILQNGLPYHPLSQGTPRRQLATEIRRVEAVCESVLLRETSFPVASDSNPQVEAWAEEVISNWEVLCGPSWRDADLGEGGQDAVSRNVLDVSNAETAYVCPNFANVIRFFTELQQKLITHIRSCGVYFTCILLWQSLILP